MKRFVEYASAVLLGLAMLLGLGVLLGPYMGWQIDKVLSGSMSPAVKVGGAVVTQKVDPATIQAGDIITYYSANETLTTIELNEDAPEPVALTILAPNSSLADIEPLRPVTVTPIVLTGNVAVPTTLGVPVGSFTISISKERLASTASTCTVIMINVQAIPILSPHDDVTT